MTRVLVVDDRPDVRLSFLYMLEACGYEVGEAATGDDALAYIARRRVDVVLTDLHMPGMDGMALIRIIRNGAEPQPRIIVMTGSSHSGDRAAIEAARQVGADAVMVKPLSRDHLVNTIRQVLGETSKRH